MSLDSSLSSRVDNADRSDSEVERKLFFFGSNGVINVPTHVTFMVTSSSKSTIGPLLIYFLLRKGNLRIA